VVNFERCYVRNDQKVEVHFTPTIPHCSMAQMIGLMIKMKLGKFLPPKYKTRVLITEGTHVN
jgi:metal-sulfur cluster biosynthetic enzyme